MVDFDFRVSRVFPVGRLDRDSRGLLLLTNDGDLAHTLMHPKHQKQKHYLVSVDKKITQDFINRLSRGVEIAPGKITARCVVKLLEEKIFEITLTEGRNRQIRRMCEVLDFRVIDLVRFRIGPINLGELKPGKFRHLSPVEIAGLAKGNTD